MRVALVLSLIPALAVVFGGGAAQAATPGRACMFNAPTGALLQGHVGWAFRSGSSDTWIFGATENTGGNPSVGAGSADTTQSWQSTGSFAEVLLAFGAGSNYNRGGNYYTQYRCRDVASSNPTQAYNQAITSGRSGYSLANNNCLTKSIDILRSYGVPNLPSGLLRVNPPIPAQPNSYFNGLPGFEATQKLKTTLAIGVLLNDPVSKSQVT